MTTTVAITCPNCHSPMTATGEYRQDSGGYWAWTFLHLCDAGRSQRGKDQFLMICDALDEAADANGVSCRLGASLRALDVVRYATEPDTSIAALRAPEGPLA